ncbi:hypothetical protein K502DRAFT_323117 [Neoconidiobolus thromboides FSU 785]|nr:hypothetical protein K502DRAFT_323117 [Neoconidiobolus thromboides FSU 785]
MALKDISITNFLPAIIFGGFAIGATIILDLKIREFRKTYSIKPKEIEKGNGKPDIIIGKDEDSKEEEIRENELEKELKDRHVLFVCMRCTYKETNCGSLIDCKLEHPENKIIDQDMEELVADKEKEGVKLKSGEILYHKLVKAHGKPNSPTRKFRKKFEIRPTRCLSVCEQGNAIALNGPDTKFAYQFAKLNQDNPKIVDDILDFSAYYIESEDGYSKNKTRPDTLKATITSRVPPKNHYSNA